jgi:hypothetical protein
VTEETNVEANNNDPVVNLELRVTEVNTILQGLQELPFKFADPLLKNIIAQAQAQLSAAAPEADTAE